MPMSPGPAAADLTAAACLFRSLADPARLVIVTHLATGEHRVGELTAHLGLAQSTVSQHLGCLRDCGLVSARAQGRASCYSLARPELLVLLRAAELLLEATGEQVALCPTYGTYGTHGTYGQDTGAGEPAGARLGVVRAER
jgi:DNA-binding transcriptional ArsR family regulator